MRSTSRWRGGMLGAKLRPATVAPAALLVCAGLLGAAAPARAHHDSATRICERDDPAGPGFNYIRLKSKPIRTEAGRQAGRLVVTGRAGKNKVRFCAVTLRKRHKHKLHMFACIRFGEAPIHYHYDEGNYRRYAGPVYLFTKIIGSPHEFSDVLVSGLILGKGGAAITCQVPHPWPRCH